jgi:hypothetical protein
LIALAGTPSRESSDGGVGFGGSRLRRTRKHDFKNLKHGALEKLGKHLGMFKEAPAVQVNADKADITQTEDWKVHVQRNLDAMNRRSKKAS